MLRGVCEGLGLEVCFFLAGDFLLMNVARFWTGGRMTLTLNPKP